MRRTDLDLGFRSHGLEDVRKLIEQSVGVPCEGRYSDYRGGYYYLGRLDIEEFRVQVNEDFPGELAEEEFPDVKVLLLISGTTREEELKKLFLQDNAVLIRETSYEVPE